MVTSGLRSDLPYEPYHLQNCREVLLKYFDIPIPITVSTCYGTKEVNHVAVPQGEENTEKLPISALD